MFETVPSLNALRAFEAAARHLSLAKAAAELRVTPSAMSHLIKSLERQLGTKLFRRSARSVALTAAGQLLYPGLYGGLVSIHDAVAGLSRRRNPRLLVISTPPSLTGRWLAARLYRFANRHPDMDLRISASAGYAELQHDGIDLAIRNMTAEAAGQSDLHVEKIIDMTLVPVCSPALLRRYNGFRARAALRRAPLIHDETLTRVAGLPEWSDWLRAADVDGVDLSRGLRFSSPEYALEAAAEGAGVLLTQTILACDDLRSGRLVVPFDVVLPSSRAYYLVRTPADVGYAPIETFRNWLFEEIASVTKGPAASRARREPR